MGTHERWLLPAGIEESLPQEAAALEQIRRSLLDLFAGWGYQLVIPPFIEYLDSLLVRASHDLNLKTFKLTDQLSGRTMGIRADITPQVARIDAHMLKQEGPTRLCYVGTVLLTLPETLGGTRSPLQIGAELYGHDGLDSDLEIARLMLNSVASIGIQDIVLDLGHVGIFKALVSKAGLNESQERQLFTLLQRKAAEDLKALTDTLAMDNALAEAFNLLGQLHGGIATLEEAHKRLSPLDPLAADCIRYMQGFVQGISPYLGSTRLHFDLAELPGYEYENGILFTLYTRGENQPVARGGRYNGIGEHFGRARAATGFSADLKLLARLSEKALGSEPRYRIYAPTGTDETTLQDARSAGHAVIRELAGQDKKSIPAECTHEFIYTKSQWLIREIKK